jgi:hypothetical protein
MSKNLWKGLSALVFLVCLTVLTNSSHSFPWDNQLVVPVEIAWDSNELRQSYGEFTLSFSENVIPLSDYDTMTNEIAKKINITVTPALKGRFKPIGSQQVVWEFLEKPKLATRYLVTLNADDIRSIDNKPVTIRVNYQQLIGSKFYLETTRLRVYNLVFSGNYPDSPARVGFNIPVKPEELSNRLDFESAAGKKVQFRVDYDYYTNETDKSDPKKGRREIRTNLTQLVIYPLDRVKATDYRLTISGKLMPAEGNIELGQDYRAENQTYMPLRLEKVRSSGYEDRFFPDSTVILEFNNPLNLKNHPSNLVSISPKPEKPVFSYEGNSIQVSANFPGGQGSDFALSGAVEDIYGQKLGTSDTEHVDFEHYLSLFGMPDGFMIMENYLDRILPFQVRNVDKMSVQTMALDSIEDIIAFYGTNWDYFDSRMHETNIAFQKADWDKTYNFRLGLKQFQPSKSGILAFRITADLQVPPRSESRFTRKGCILFTDMGLTVKSSPEKTWVFVRNLKDNQPVAGAKIYLVENGQANAVGTSDASGMCTVDRGYPMPAVIAEKNGVLSFNFTIPAHSGGNNEEEDYYQNTPGYVVNSGDTYTYKQSRLLLFSDRYLYSPGDTVEIKGILRHRASDAWTLNPPENFPASLKLTFYDSRNEQITNVTLVPDDYDSFHYSLPVSKNAPTGYYRVDSEYGETSFRVEEFKPARAEVKILPEKNLYQWGDTFRADMIGWYLFGAPVQRPVQYDLSITPIHYSSETYPDYQFGIDTGWDSWEGEGEDYGYRDYSTPLTSGIAVAGPDGKSSMTCELKRDDFKSDGRLTLSATLTLEDASSVSGIRTGIDVMNPVHVGIRKPGFFMNAGETTNFGIIALDPKEQVVKDFPVNVIVDRSEWVSSQKAGVNGRLSWEWKEVKTRLLSRAMMLGQEELPITPDKPGYYTVHALFRSRGHESETAASFYALGSGNVGWAAGNDNTVELIPDKKTYDVGETARVLVKNPFRDGTALVTLEREKIHETWQVPATNSVLVIPVKISRDFIPNVYVSVVLFSGRTGTNQVKDDVDLARPRFLMGYADLRVVPDGKRIAIGVRPNAETYGPGDMAHVDLEAKDSAGNPVDTELTVSIADKGVLNLVDYRLPDPLSYFYQPRPLAVFTSDARNFIYGQRYLSEKGELIGGDGGFAAMGMITPRSDIRYTAFYNEAIRTKDGKASFDFKIPDNLSGFRIMVAAQTKSSEFGYSEHDFTVRKPLMVMSSLPMFLRYGDSLLAGGTVFNYTGKDREITVSLEADQGLEIDGTNRRTITNITVPDNASREVLFPVKVKRISATAVKLTLKAATENYSDGVEESVPLRNPNILETMAIFEKTETSKTETLQISDNIVPDFSSVSFFLSPTAFSDLKGSLDYLIDYPHGCLEQKASGILPLVLGEDVILKHGLLQNKSQGDLRKLVQDVLDEFPQFADGNGFYYWTDKLYGPNPYLTVYAGFVLTMAKKKGYTVDDAFYNRVIGWVKEYADGRGAFEYDNAYYRALVRNYALYVAVLNGYENVGSLRNACGDLKGKLKDLTSAQAYALMTLSHYKDFLWKDQLRKDILSIIMGKARTEAQTVYFADYNDWGWFYFNDTISTALILQALLESGSDFPEAFKTINYLVRARKDSSAWRTTHENAMVFWAFNTYLEMYESVIPNFKANVRRDAKDLINTVFKSRLDKPYVSELRIPNNLIGSVPITLSKTGDGTLYYYIQYRYLLKDYPKSRDLGFSLDRKISDYDTGAEVTNNAFVRGKRYLVQITVRTVKNRYFAVVDDQLPAGFEPVHLDFATEANEKHVDDKGSGWYGFTHREIYRDHVAFYARELPAGEYHLQLVVRANVPGSFHTPMLKAEEMYAPEVSGMLYQDDVTIASN